MLSQRESCWCILVRMYQIQVLGLWIELMQQRFFQREVLGKSNIFFQFGTDSRWFYYLIVNRLSVEYSGRMQSVSMLKMRSPSTTSCILLCQYRFRTLSQLPLGFILYAPIQASPVKNISRGSPTSTLSIFVQGKTFLKISCLVGTWRNAWRSY